MNQFKKMIAESIAEELENLQMKRFLTGLKIHQTAIWETMHFHVSDLQKVFERHRML